MHMLNIVTGDLYTACPCNSINSYYEFSACTCSIFWKLLKQIFHVKMYTKIYGYLL
jgi:hypothetical protein